MRKNNIQVIWHSCAPQTWASELRASANGLAQINPEILQRPEWAKFRQAFHLESYMTSENLQYIHLLEDVTMFHTTNRARNGEGTSVDVSKTMYIPHNRTQEQRDLVDGMYRQCDLVSSDLEIIAIQNDPHMPIHSKLLYFEGDDHVKSQMAALGQVLGNYSTYRKRYNGLGKEISENTTLKIGAPIQQLSRPHDSDRLHFAKVILGTQVDDVKLQPCMEVRIPMQSKRGERNQLIEKRRARLSSTLPLWQVNEQLAKESRVYGQVLPNPKFKSSMPENWFKRSAYDDTRAFDSYQKLLQESPAHFAEVR